MKFNFHRVCLIFIFFISGLLSLNVHAGIVDRYYQHNLDKFNSVENIAPDGTFNMVAKHRKMSTYFREKTNIKEYSYSQLVDHHHPEVGTFSQRYFVDETFATSNQAPVFLVICGEGACGKGYLKGAIRKLAEKKHARLVAVEHRYYGDSLPRPTFSTEDLQYLTTEEALADLSTIQTYLSHANHWTGKWIAFGGSYSGSLAAYYRMKYPNQVAGALASSAPVMAKENVPEFDEHTTKMVGESCAKNLKEVVSEIESALNDEKRIKNIKKMFNADDIENNLDFLSLITEIGTSAVQFGLKNKLCTALSISKALGSPLKGYAGFTRLAFYLFHIKPSMLTPQGALSENPADYENKLVGARQWFYQTCTEYGYFQPATQDKARSTRSSYIDLSYYKNICRRLFNIEESPDTTSHNINYYQPLFNASTSRIFFTNGSVDPWSLLSLAESNGNATNKNLIYLTMEGASHCADVSNPSFFDSKAVKLARSQLDGLVDAWLQG